MNDRKIYRVHGSVGAFDIDADWGKPAWRRAETGLIGLHMGPRPKHFPDVRFRVLYDETNVYVIFRVEDRFVRAAGRHDEDPVYQDSCVEFFFTPGEDLAKGYFNFETNCRSARLWHHQFDRSAHVKLAPGDLARVKIAHSLMDFEEEELQGPVEWVIEYQVPVEILGHYARVTAPAPGARWRGNFQKCADLSSHPHYLIWSPIARPKPDFHVPECFGVLEFE